MIENLRLKNSEWLVLAENSRETAERMTESEAAVMAERLTALTGQLEDSQRALAADKKEHIIQVRIFVSIFDIKFWFCVFMMYMIKKIIQFVLL